MLAPHASIVNGECGIEQQQQQNSRRLNACYHA